MRTDLQLWIAELRRLEAEFKTEHIVRGNNCVVRSAYGDRWFNGDGWSIPDQREET